MTGTIGGMPRLELESNELQLTTSVGNVIDCLRRLVDIGYIEPSDTATILIRADLDTRYSIPTKLKEQVE